MAFFFTRRFLRSLKKLPPAVREDVLYAVDLFQSNRESPALRLHKLSGRLKSYHAFSANFSHRIIVALRKNDAYFTTVGDHDVYE